MNEFVIAGLPHRSKKCASCNYQVTERDLDYGVTKVAKQFIPAFRPSLHRCHSAPGSVCAGSLLSLLSPDELERHVQNEFLNLMASGAVIARRDRRDDHEARRLPRG